MLKPTLVVGTNAEAAHVLRILRRNPSTGLVPIGCLASSQAEQLGLDFCSRDVPVLGSARDVRRVVIEHAVDTVVIAASAFDHDVLSRIVAELRDMPVDLSVSSGLFEVLSSRALVRELGGIPLVTVKGLRLSRSKLFAKRLFDLAVAGSVLLVGLPFWLLIAALVKPTSPGPVFFAQERVGREGRTFKMLKFRSMVVGADARVAELEGSNQATGPLFRMADDPRVAAVGRWLRKFSLDEFPQLINVIVGEMSLVGPRPPLPREVGQYSDGDWRRLDVPPGMTGLWRVSGRSRLTFEDMVRLDVFCIENWSVSLDLAIMARTLPAVLVADGAY